MKIYTFEFGILLDKETAEKVGFDREAKNECSFLSKEEMEKESLEYIKDALFGSGAFYIEYYEDDQELDAHDIKEIKKYQGFVAPNKSNLLREIKIITEVEHD